MKKPKAAVSKLSFDMDEEEEEQQEEEPETKPPGIIFVTFFLYIIFFLSFLFFNTFFVSSLAFNIAFFLPNKGELDSTPHQIRKRSKCKHSLPARQGERGERGTRETEPHS